MTLEIFLSVGDSFTFVASQHTGLTAEDLRTIIDDWSDSTKCPQSRLNIKHHVPPNTLRDDEPDYRITTVIDGHAIVAMKLKESA